MAKLSAGDPLYKRLEERVGRLHLCQRMGIEADHEKNIFGQGYNFFHIENWYSIHSVIRNTLRLSFLYGRGRKNAHNIQISKNDLPITNLPEAFSGYTILHISDLHLDMTPGTPHALIEKIRQVDYDLCVLTGDFRAKTFGSYDDTLQAMRNVRTHLKSPVYAVLGNHDSIEMVPYMEEMDIKMLINECVAIEKDGAVLHLAGVDDPHYFQAHNLEKATSGIPYDEPSILLAHSPEIYKHAAHADFDVMLCGHTHGGQICLPGGTPIMRNARCPRKYCSGAWEYHQLQGYTSRGSGSCVVDVRLNCPPEITLHHLSAAK